MEKSRMENGTRLESGDGRQRNIEKVSKDILTDIAKERGALEQNSNAELAQVEKLIQRLNILTATMGEKLMSQHPEIASRVEQERIELAKIKSKIESSA